MEKITFKKDQFKIYFSTLFRKIESHIYITMVLVLSSFKVDLRGKTKFIFKC